jgi:hypothetical protein
MPLLDTSLFKKVVNSILHICMIVVYSDMMKKLEVSYVNLENPKITNYTKSLTVRQSIRKKNLTDGEALINTDVHMLFVNAFKVIIILFSKLC